MKIFKISMMVALIALFLFSIKLYLFMFQHGIKVGLNGLTGWPVVLIIEAILGALIYFSFNSNVLRLSIGAVILIIQIIVVFRLFAV